MAASRDKSDALGSMPRRFLSALERLEDAHTDLTIKQFRHLMYVAENPGTTVAEAYRALGTDGSTASRAFALLSDVGTPKRGGMYFIELVPDDQDRRLKRLYLTTKGLRFLTDLRKDLGL